MNTELSNSELRRLDLNLLLVFLGLLKHRKAVDVAAEMGLSRSGVSQALGRLRDIFGDPLFLRHSHGLQPTAVALALEMPVTEAVELLRNAMGNATRFVPRKAKGTIYIGANDVDQAVLIPELAGHLYRHAPGLRLEIIPCQSEDAVTTLKDGRADLVIAESVTAHDQIREEVLFNESWLAVCKPDIMSGANQISAENYAIVPHIVIKTGSASDALNHANAGNHCIALTVPSYMSGLAVVAQAGGIVIVPARLGQMFASKFGLCTAAVPDCPPPYDVCALTHIRNDRDARLQWVLGQIKSVIGSQPG